MTSSGNRARALLLGVSVALAVSSAAPLASAQSKAPSSEELKAARELFQQAYKDEQEHRYADALDKFGRVAAVKESGSVRYRIGSVLESLGRLREARDAFRAIAASKPTLAPNEQEIAGSAAERALALDKRIPRINVQMHDNSPADARVSIDGAPVSVSTTARSVELDPGEHVLRATSPTSQPSESKVMLQEGATVTVDVVLEPLETKRAPPPPPTPAPVDTGPHRDNTRAYIALGAGGALLIVGFIVLAIREGDISDLNKECRSGTCPIGKMTELQSEHDQAQVFGPLGVGLALVGLAGVGYGGYLLFRPAPPSAAAPAANVTTSAPSVSRQLRIVPRALAGGALLGLAGDF